MDFEVSLILFILRWSSFAGVDHGCLSCVFKFRIPATMASTTGEKCFVCHAEYTTHGTHENINFMFFLFARQTSWKTHCGTNGNKESFAGLEYCRNPLSERNNKEPFVGLQWWNPLREEPFWRYLNYMKKSLIIGFAVTIIRDSLSIVRGSLYSKGLYPIVRDSLL